MKSFTEFMNETVMRVKRRFGDRRDALNASHQRKMEGLKKRRKTAINNAKIRKIRRED